MTNSLFEMAFPSHPNQNKQNHIEQPVHGQSMIITWEILVEIHEGTFVPHKRPVMKDIQVMNDESFVPVAVEGETCLMMDRHPYHRF